MNKDISIDTLNTRAVDYTKTVLDEVFVHDNTHQAVIVYDTDSTLSTILSNAYRNNLPDAIFINFHENTQEQIRAVFDTLEAEDMVIP